MKTWIIAGVSFSLILVVIGIVVAVVFANKRKKVVDSDPLPIITSKPTIPVVPVVTSPVVPSSTVPVLAPALKPVEITPVAPVTKPVVTTTVKPAAATTVKPAAATTTDAAAKAKAAADAKAKADAAAKAKATADAKAKADAAAKAKSAADAKAKADAAAKAKAAADSKAKVDAAAKAKTAADAKAKADAAAKAKASADAKAKAKAATDAKAKADAAAKAKAAADAKAKADAAAKAKAAAEAAKPWSLVSSEFGKAKSKTGNFAPFNFDCGENYVTSLYGASGDYVDSIGVTCSDGTIFKAVGGAGGKPFQIIQVQGIQKMGIRGGDIVDGLVVGDKTLGGPGGVLSTIDCSRGVLTSVSGKANSQQIGAMSIVCKDIGNKANKTVYIKLKGTSGAEKVRFYIVNDKKQQIDLLDADVKISKKTTKLSFVVPGNSQLFIIDFLNDSKTSNLTLELLEVDGRDVKPNRLIIEPKWPSDRKKAAPLGTLNWGGQYKYPV
jgi:hypothetical protein